MLPIYLYIFLSIFSWVSSASGTTAATRDDFVTCLSSYYSQDPFISKVIHTPINPSYSSVLDFSIQNLRFNTTSTPKPLAIITAANVLHIQATIKCSQQYGLDLRIRSGGHDFEGLSYASVFPFVILDLINLRDITVDEEDETAWVQAGATMGEVHHAIAQKSRTLGFPGGVYASVGVGGLFTGGGYGVMMRKYGLAADNIIDAQIIDVNCRILDRSSMGEDLFWAIRGGGGNTFGVIIAWKIKLYRIPETLTVAMVKRTLEQDATKLLHRWQYVADKFVDDLFMATVISRVKSSSQDGNNPTIQVAFHTFFLGGVDRLVQLVQESFPELGMVKEDCKEMTYLESLVYFNGFNPKTTSFDVLLQRVLNKISFKRKCDYTYDPIPEFVFEEIWKRFYELDAGSAMMYMVPYGGKMDEIPESSIPFPHRAGTLNEIQYQVTWLDSKDEARHLSWVRSLYDFMTPYVAKNPRVSYFNYRDLDIGMNNLFCSSYEQAKIWGEKYFKSNFDRLVAVKTQVDPANFFRTEQSIPPLTTW